MSKKYLALLIIILGIGISIASILISNNSNTKNEDPERITVAATVFPLADIVKNVGGDRIKVVTLVPPGANEHSYALSAAQVSQVAAAKAIFAIGHKLDDHIVSPLQRAHNISVTVVDQAITLREYDGEGATDEDHNEEEGEARDHDTGTDPHYWLTIPNGQRIATTIAQTLQQIDPPHAAEYATNLATYLDELSNLESELQRSSRSAPHKEFIAMHNAWSYLAPHYGFELVATYEPTEGSQPSLQDLQRLGELIAQHQITTFFAEPQKVSSSATKVMRDEFGLQIDILDPTGGVSGRNSYIELMQANIAALAQ